MSHEGNDHLAELKHENFLENIGNYILWVGGIDDHYSDLSKAEIAKLEWEEKGYDDVCIETKKEFLERRAK